MAFEPEFPDLPMTFLQAQDMDGAPAPNPNFGKIGVSLTGSSFTSKPMKVQNSRGEWIQKAVKYWDGNQWTLTPPIAIVPASTFDTNTANSSSDFAFSNGNNTATRNSNTGNVMAVGTQGKSITTGEGYFEVTCVTAAGGGAQMDIGIAKNGNPADYVHDRWCGYVSDNRINFFSATLSTGATWTTGDIIGVYLKNGIVWFHKNGAWQGSGGDPSAAGAGYSISGAGITDTPLYPAVSTNGASPSFTLNTGGSFAYSVPTGGHAWG